MTIEENIAILKGQIKFLCVKFCDTPSTDIESSKTIIEKIKEHKNQICQLLEEKEREEKISNYVHMFNCKLNRITEI